ncbi:MAG: class I tRNA ligase family protein, partial [Helicobacter sp.]|nr:class I tRNA ligase family protein [Helicobacter sp.]
KITNLTDIGTPKTALVKYLGQLLSQTIQEVRENLESYRFNDAANALYKFLWGNFCDWGIELSKANKESISELGAIFKESMLLLHPFMPFLSEYLWHELDGSSLQESGSIMIKPYPTFSYSDSANFQIFELILETIVSIRRSKTTINLANQKIKKVYVRLNHEIPQGLINLFHSYVSKLAKVEEIQQTKQKIPNCIIDITEKLETYIPTNDIDLSPIITRLQAQSEKTQKEIDKLQSLLNNEKFLANAPQNVLLDNQKMLLTQQEKLQKIHLEIKSLQNL